MYGLSTEMNPIIEGALYNQVRLMLVGFFGHNVAHVSWSTRHVSASFNNIFWFHRGNSMWTKRYLMPMSVGTQLKTCTCIPNWIQTHSSGIKTHRKASVGTHFNCNRAWVCACTHTLINYTQLWRKAERRMHLIGLWMRSTYKLFNNQLQCNHFDGRPGWMKTECVSVHCRALWDE